MAALELPAVETHHASQRHSTLAQWHNILFYKINLKFINERILLTWVSFMLCLVGASFTRNGGNTCPTPKKVGLKKVEK